jgi:hypothetical protein
MESRYNTAGSAIMKTSERLAAELRKIATEKSVPAPSAAKYEAFAKRAETGEFDDYATPSDPAHICPIMQLYTELTAAGFYKFAQRVAQGEFDATQEESDEYWASPQGQADLAHLSPAVRKALFGEEQ